MSKGNPIQELIEASLADARVKVASMRAIPTQEEGKPDLRQRLSKLAHVFTELATDPNAIQKWAQDENPADPYSGTANEDVQPPTDASRSTSETQLKVQVESSPHTQQGGTETVPATNEDRDTTTTNDSAISAVTETPKGVAEKQAMLHATARIFQAAENNRVPNIAKIASATGLSQRLVSDLLTHIVRSKTAGELPPALAAAIGDTAGDPPEKKEEKKEEKTEEKKDEKKEEKKEFPPTESEKAARALWKRAQDMEEEEKKEEDKKEEKKPSDTSSTSPAVDEEKKEVPPEKTAEDGEVAATESHSSPEQPEVYAAGDRGPQSSEIPFLNSPEATTAFKKRQAKLVSNSGSLAGVLSTKAYKDPVLHQQFENAEAAGVKTQP